MTEDRQKWAEMLKKIGSEEALVWISNTASTCAAPDFKGKTGWLRFMNSDGLENLVAGTLPDRKPDGLMSGEWVDGNSSVSAKLTSEGLMLRILSEAAEQSGDAIPVLQHEIETLTRAIPSCPEGSMQIAVYMGFRSQGDFEEGKLSTIAERFIGFFNEPLPAQKEGAT